jgi:hypothetical protein
LKIIAVIIAVVGIMLCIVWMFLLCQSLKAQDFYKREVEKLEKTQGNHLNFKIFSKPGWQELGRGFLSIKVLSFTIIGLFVFLYLLLVIFIVT